ncbi:TPA: hypothetical protein ACN376_003929 [Vibrio parahaemolyticus]|nr:hypothetical protein [Vibrio parahaemolyticus]
MKKEDMDKVKHELLSHEKITLPKWVIFIGFTSDVMFKPVALLAYIPIIMNVVSLLADSEFKVFDSLLAVLLSLCCLLILSSTIMKSMASDGVLELYLSLVFEKKAIPKFLKSKFQK